MNTQYAIATQTHMQMLYKDIHGNWTPDFSKAFRCLHPLFVGQLQQDEESFMVRVNYITPAEVIRVEVMRNHVWRAPARMQAALDKQKQMYSPPSTLSWHEQVVQVMQQLQQGLTQLTEQEEWKVDDLFASYVACFRLFLTIGHLIDAPVEHMGLPKSGMTLDTTTVLHLLTSRIERIMISADQQADAEYYVYLLNEFLLLGVQRFDFSMHTILAAIDEQRSISNE